MNCPICNSELKFLTQEQSQHLCDGFFCKKNHYLIGVTNYDRVPFYEGFIVDEYVIERGHFGTLIDKNMDEYPYIVRVLEVDYVLDFSKFSNKEKIEKLLVLI